MMAEFKLKMSKLRKDFMEREAKVYYQTYLEVVDAVNYYAKRHEHRPGDCDSTASRSIRIAARTCSARSTSRSSFQDRSTSRRDVLVLLNRDQTGRPAAWRRSRGLRPAGVRRFRSITPSLALAARIAVRDRRQSG